MRKLKNFVSSYLEYVENSEPPRLFCLWVCFGIIGAALRRKCWLQWETETYPNMYVILVGPPASKKGTALDQGRFLLNHVDQVKLAADSSTLRKLVSDLDKSIAITSFGDKVIHHSSLTIFNNELIVLLNKKNAVSILPVLNDLYDCRPKWNYGTEFAGTHNITNTWLHMLAGLTPDQLTENITFDAVGAGFASRVLFIYGDKEYKHVSRPHKLRAPQKLVDDLVYDLTEMSMLAGEFKLTNEAEDWYDVWYEKTKAHRFRHDRVLGAYIGRRAKHLLKLSMIVSASVSDSLIIELNHLQEASQYLEQVENLFPLVLSGISKVPEAALSDLIAFDLDKEKRVRFSAIVRRYYHTFNSDIIGRAIMLLISTHRATRSFIPESEDYWISLPNESSKNLTQPTQHDDFLLIIK